MVVVVVLVVVVVVVVLTHVTSMLFSLTPTPAFRPLGPAGSRVLRVKVS